MVDNPIQRCGLLQWQSAGDIPAGKPFHHQPQRDQRRMCKSLLMAMSSTSVSSKGFWLTETPVLTLLVRMTPLKPMDQLTLW